MIPDALIEEVRRRADIVEILSEHTRLKRSGKTFRGPCPLHGGTGPNFSVDPGQGFYKCYVCGKGGTVFTFLQEHLGMNYPDAVRHVAARVGVEIPDAREQQRPEDDPHAHFHEVNAFAAEWFRKQLWQGEGGAAARAYLERRGIAREAAERFGLGWAPEAWTALGEAARKHGLPDETLLALGLVKEPRRDAAAGGGTRRSGTPYDAFRGRVIFPIESLGGRVIAFGGRLIAEVEGAPKYLNSPETPVYRKGEQLYGLSWSRNAIRRAEVALLVEGYMDYVSLASHGVENVVAGLGTALTEEQATLLARYTKRVVSLYDSDRAGLKATFRSGDELLRAGVEVLVATLPPGEDPDSLVRARGARALQAHLDDAVDLLERKLQILERRGYFASIADTRRAVDALLPTLRATRDELLRGIYFSRVAEKTGVPRETLEREAGAPDAAGERAGAGRGERSGGQRPQPGGRSGRPAAREAPPGPVNLGAERNVLKVLLRDESYVEAAAKQLHVDDFRDPVHRAIYEGLLHSEGIRDPEGAWLAIFPADARERVEDLRGDPELEHVPSTGEYFDASLRSLRLRPYEERLARLEQEIGAAPGDAEKLKLAVEKDRLLKEMRERGLIRSRFVREPVQRYST